MIRLRRRTAPPANVRDTALLFRLIRAAFNQRRKTLCNAMMHGLGLSRPDALSVIEGCGFDPRIRGEAIGLDGFAALSDALSAMAV